MCITFWYTPTVPASPASPSTSERPGGKGESPYAFILLSNRDLELGRPASDASWHSFEPITPHSYGRSKVPLPRGRSDHKQGDKGNGKGRRILSGRDAADPVGGTWLGLAAYTSPASRPPKHARIGVLTNIHDDSPVPKGTRTRGCLIKDWLLWDASEGDERGLVDPEEGTKRYLDGLKDEAVALAGFNLLLFDISLDAPPETDDETGGTQVRRVSAHQLTNRYRPHPTSPPNAHPIPADTSTINTSHTSRTLPTSPNPSHASTSPLGTFRSAITDLRPTALRLGGMSNSLLEEPFEKVVVGIGEFEEILGREFTKGQAWDEGREEKLLGQLFGLMSETHPVERFQDLERAICVPLCGIPLPGMTGTPYEHPHEHYHSNRDADRVGTHVPRVDAVHARTLLGTPARTPEGSPDRGSSRSLPTLNEDVPNPTLTTTQSRPVPACTLTHGHKAKPYGTRLTTIILVKWNGEVTYVERDVWWMDEMGSVHKGGTEDRVFRFRL